MSRSLSSRWIRLARNTARVPSAVIAVSLVASTLVACESAESTPDAGDQVTYYGDVRPILVENCVMCHTEGGIAPFTLQTYDAAVEVSERMLEVTRDRIMPPFLADSSGECNTWSNHRGLTDEEIALIGQWVVTGTAEGDPTIEAPTPGVLPTLDSVDVTIEMPEMYLIDQSIDDDYRCFVVETGTTEDQFVTGYDVHPGNAQRAHHVIVYAPLDEGEVDAAVALDAAEGAPNDGYSCFGGPRVDAPPLVLWAPGTGATRFPRGTGIRLAAGRRLIIQVHYNNLVDDGTPNTDRTTIELMTASTANEAYLALFADYSLNLPPRMEEVVESDTASLSFLPTTVRIWGVFPHMHTLGRTLQVDLLRGDGAEQCLVDIPRWDFNWQLAYWLDTPISIGSSDSARITCSYNTMSRDETVNWGDGTQDEMCLSFVYVSL